MTRLTHEAIDAVLGQTPCLCGDCETWHSKCYEGKTQAQIDAKYVVAYRRAKLVAKALIASKSKNAIAKASGEPDK